MQFISILLTFVFCLSLPISIKAETVDRIVATVDENIITLSELNEEGHTYFQAIMQNVPTQQLESEMQKARKEVLDQLIERLLIQQQADKFGIKISEEDIDITIDSILMENNISIADFKRDLETRGSSEDVYRQKIRSKMLRSRLINFLIRSKIVISDEKIQNYYTLYYANKPTASGFHILQMGFLWGDKYKAKNQEEARQKAEYVRKKILEGEDFKILARNYSDLPSAEDGGDIGIFEEKELAAYMRDTILAMQPGETTPIVQTPVGFQILKLLSSNKDNSLPSSINDVRDEIKNLLFRQEMEKGYDQWINDIRSNSYIKLNL